MDSLFNELALIKARCDYADPGPPGAVGILSLVAVFLRSKAIRTCQAKEAGDQSELGSA